MTNKTYFMRSFNLILYLFLFAPICSAFGWLFNYLSVQLTNITFVNLDTVKSITDIISSVCHGFALISLLLALFLVGLEIIQRLKTDSLWNYIFGTISNLSITLFCCDTSCFSVNEYRR